MRPQTARMGMLPRAVAEGAGSGAAGVRELPDGNEATSRRKGNKRRIAKDAEGAEHANPA